MLNLLRFVLRAKALRSAVPHAATFAFAAALGLAALPASARAESPDSVPGSLEMDLEEPAFEEASGEFENDPPEGEELPPVFDSFDWVRIGDTFYVTGQVTSLTGGDTVTFGGVASGSVTVDENGIFFFNFSYAGLPAYFTAVATDLNGVESDVVIEVI